MSLLAEDAKLQCRTQGPQFDVNPELQSEYRRRLLEPLHEYEGCFSTSERVQQMHTAKHRIIVDDTVRPIKQMPYRVSQKERETIQRQVQEMLDDDVIQPSCSPWSSPVVLVKKKDGTFRFCVDYRKLNNVTKKDVYPLPRIDDTFDRLRHSTYFSSMDLKSGYWQIEVDERDREKTAFVTPDGLYEFKVMPFELCTAPATFQRVMDTVLAGLKWQTCLVYLDDVVVFAPDFDEHLRRLRVILDTLKKAHLTLKPAKCHFGYQELKFLGHVITPKGVLPDPDKTKAVANFPTPQSKKDLRSFLGLCSYYRRFIRSFSKIAAPLTRLTKKDVDFSWGSEEEAAFQDLKKRILTAPVLGHFHEEARTEIHTDASNKGLGAVLVQWQNDEERVIAYASRSLSKSEANYLIKQMECLAVIWAITKFRPYLYGRPFSVVTDHHSLCWLANLRNPSGRLARWGLQLQEFDAQIVYRSGRQHSDADCLSRFPLSGDNESRDDDELFLGMIDVPTLSEKQRLDPELNRFIHYLDNPHEAAPRHIRRVLQSLRFQDGVLYKENHHPQGDPWLLIIPTEMQGEVLEACHDHPPSGHLGYTRTLARIRRKYYWPRLAKCVRRYVKTCHDCQRRKSPPLKPAGFLHSISPPRSPFHQLGMDLLGPFPSSASGNRWIVVCTDYSTRYAETKAVPHATAKEVAKFFIEQIVLRHGAPEAVITDRGAAFTANLMQEILRLSHTQHRRTTAYHPQTNGLTERLNKTLGDMLAMYVDIEHKTWDEILPYVTFAYNTAIQETTGYTPFHLVYGREPTTMLDAMLPHQPDPEIVLTRPESPNEPKKPGSWQGYGYSNSRAVMRVVTTCADVRSASHLGTSFGCGLQYDAAASAKSF